MRRNKCTVRRKLCCGLRMAEERAPLLAVNLAAPESSGEYSSTKLVADGGLNYVSLWFVCELHDVSAS